MNYRITGLDPAPFQHYFAMDDAALSSHGASRAFADASPGYPCRISLGEAAAGEELILLSYAHQLANSPYRAAGPIYVGRNAAKAAVLINEIPASFQSRLLSVRAYDVVDFIVEAEVVEGAQLAPMIERFFARAEVAYLHVHYARRGCYAGRIDRL
jgi:Protein of unknown function (DUF1203)